MVTYGFNANLSIEGNMRKEATQKEDQFKIWMTDDELLAAAVEADRVTDETAAEGYRLRVL